MLSIQAVLNDAVVWIYEIQDRICIVLLTCREYTNLIHRTQVAERLFQMLPYFDVQTDGRWLVRATRDRHVEL